MNAVGIDIGKSTHALAAISAQHELVFKPRMFHQNAEGLKWLLQTLESLGGTQGVKVGMEATGHYWKPLRHFLVTHGYTVDVFNPLLSAKEAAADVRGRKTDPLDAIAIARVVVRGHYSPAPAADPAMDCQKSLMRLRKALVGHRADAKRRARACLDVLFPEAENVFDDLFSRSALALLEQFPSARTLATADLRRLRTLLKEHSRGRLGPEIATALREAARASICLTLVDEGEEIALVESIREIRYLDERIARVERESLERPAPRAAELLASIKGVGLKLAVRIVAEIGDPGRFAQKGPAKKMSRRILAFAGSEPRVRSSGQWKGRDKISKRGSPSLRTNLYLAASTARLHTPLFREIYQRQMDRGKHHGVAINHVVRKLIEVFCGMYKTNSPFTPQPIELPC